MAGERVPEADAESDKAFAALLDRATVKTPDGRCLLGPVSFAIRKGEHWAVLGPNGAGKTTLLRLLGAERHPSSGSVTVLGARLGASDLRVLRSRVGVVSHAVADRLPPSATALAIVLTGGRGVLAPWWAHNDEADRLRGRQILAALGCSALADRAFGSCSQGERQRVLLARSLFVEHPLLLLDEPCAGVDLPGREALVLALTALARSPGSPTTVHVSHSLEELPATTSHALLLRAGEVVAMGPIEDVMTGQSLGRCFGLAVSLSREDGRWTARASPSW
ncbi:MAG: ATP-binding cassette domain-containing protein [Acidimicrobiales bacterium]|jgi:iron complex transport system ATP-binding protein